jgi:hypothetical protein
LAHNSKLTKFSVSQPTINVDVTINAFDHQSTINAIKARRLGRPERGDL